MGNTKRKNAKTYEPGTLAFLAVLGILLIALGVISLLSVVGGLNGVLFSQVKLVMQGLGGSLCVGVSALLVWCGVLVAFSSGRSMPKRGILLMTLLYLSVLAMFNLLSSVGQQSLMETLINYNNTQFSPPLVEADGFVNMLRACYAYSAANGVFGGALGMLLAWPAWTFMGTTLSVVLLSLICVACTLLFTRFDFLQLFESVREGAQARGTVREQRRAEQERQRMLAEQEQQAAMEEKSLRKPAFLRRAKKDEQQAPPSHQPVQPMQPVYPPYGSMIAQPPMQSPYMGMPGYPQSALPAMPPMPAQSQPELYNEIITPQGEQPTWRRGGAKRDKASQTAPADVAYQTRMTFTPSEMGVPLPAEAEAIPNDSLILSSAKRKALERIEEIRKRKAEINAELDGNRAVQGADMEILPPMTEAKPSPVQPPAKDPRRAAPEIDREQAYKRPVPMQERKGTLAPQPQTDAPKDRPERKPYVYPAIELLNLERRTVADTRELDTQNATCLEKTLESFGIPARVQRVTHGPAVTRFELGLVSSGINVKRILSIADNIALDMAANGGVRIEIPIPGTNLFGIEVPNTEVQSVSLAEVLLSPEMKKAKSSLAVALGLDIAGRPIICDLEKMPHLLIAGQTGSGKSVCVNTIINSLLFRSSPEEVRMIMIDPKVVELQSYNAVPHLLIPVVSDPHKAAGALAWAVAEMLDRYHKMQSKNAKKISEYNAKLGPDEEKLPRIVIIIDELSDLMLACKKEVEESIIRIAQLARAAGIHMVVATQRPTVDVITGLIKANIPSRIAFAVASSIDSRTILDQNGAEKLLGRGDMFYYPTGASAPVRVQGCFMSDVEAERVIDYIARNSQVDFDPNVIEALESEEEILNPLEDGGEDSGLDDRLAEAVEMVISDGQASISMLQRRMKIGYARAGRLIDDMAARGIVSKSVGSKPREVLMSREEYDRIKETLK